MKYKRVFTLERVLGKEGTSLRDVEPQESNASQDAVNNGAGETSSSSRAKL
jgi:hypothetical protein